MNGFIEIKHRYSNDRIKSGKGTFINLLLTTLIFTLCISYNVYAYQEYCISDDKIRAIISSNKINRIEFDVHGIAQVIGDDSRYQFISDDRGMNIFLKTGGQEEGNIELSLISQSGVVADLVLTPKDNIEGQVIRIKSIPNNNALNNSFSLEVKNLLRTMIRDEAGKYYVRSAKNIIDLNKTGNPRTGLKIIQDRIYRYKDLIGTRLIVSNKNSKQSLILNKTDFEQVFESTVAVHIASPNLLPLSKTYVWLISKEARND